MSDQTSAEGLAAKRLRLGALTLDLAAGELLATDGRPAALRRQALEVLLALGARAGQVVTKDELMRRVWPDVVVGDGSLAQAITDIRRVLGDAAHERVRNVARRGYLLVPDEAVEAAPARPEPPPSEDAAPAPGPRPRRVAVRALLLIAVLAVLGGAAWRLWPRGGTETAPTLVVLPLKAIGDGAGSRTIAEGLSEELIGSLARIEGLRVIARPSTALAAAESTDPARLAERLGVTHLLEGSSQRAGQALRVRLRLVAARGGDALWTRDFDRDASEVLLLQREIAEAVAASLTLKLGLAAMPVAKSGDAEFLRRFMAAQAQVFDFRQPVEESTEWAESEFRALLRQRPDDARVHAALSMTLVVRAVRRLNQQAALREEALHEATIAQRLDPSLPEPYWAQGLLGCNRNEWQTCLPRLQEAGVRGAKLQLIAYDRALMLARLGYLSQAEAEARAWIARDPLNGAVHFVLARVLDTQGRHDEAQASFARAGTSPEGRWLNAVWRRDFAQAADFAARTGTGERSGYQVLTQALTDASYWPGAEADLRKLDAEVIPLRLLRVLAPDAPGQAAAWIAEMNDIRQRRGHLTWDLLLWTRDLVWLRSDPAFQAYLRDNGMLAYWRAHGFPPQCRPQGDGAACE